MVFEGVEEFVGQGSRELEGAADHEVQGWDIADGAGGGGAGRELARCGRAVIFERFGDLRLGEGGDELPVVPRGEPQTERGLGAGEAEPLARGAFRG